MGRGGVGVRRGVGGDPAGPGGRVSVHGLGGVNAELLLWRVVFEFCRTESEFLGEFEGVKTNASGTAHEVSSVLFADRTWFATDFMPRVRELCTGPVEGSPSVFSLSAAAGWCDGGGWVWAIWKARRAPRSHPGPKIRFWLKP